MPTQGKNLKKTNIEELSYEQAYIQLEEIVHTLEANDHPLEDALSLFERAQMLIHHCTELLDHAELKVKQIIGNELVDFPKQD